MMIRAFLLGVVATSSVTAGVFFLKFWKQTRDSLFLAFALAFIVEGLNRTSVLFFANPSEYAPYIYGVRLLAFLLILGAILRKNYGRAA
jgi:L-asparagine transporter-like permease